MFSLKSFYYRNKAIIWMTAGLFGLLIFVQLFHTPAYRLDVSNEEMMIIGEKIWQNEVLEHNDKLIDWAEGTTFPTLGIGHFIWYRAQDMNIYHETFPDFLDFAKHHGATLPKWLDTTPFPGCPWHSREALQAAKEDPRLISLHTFLNDSIPLQAQFMVYRLKQAFPNMLSHEPPRRRLHVQQQFARLSKSLDGLYDMVDYVDFKGEGTHFTERYQEEGWGLLQVLENMDPKVSRQQPLHAFADAATLVLANRVANAPDEHNEAQYWEHWLDRIATYY